MDIQTIALLVYSVVLPVFVLFVPKGLLTTKIYSNVYRVKKPSLLALVECYTPFRNTIIIKKSLGDLSTFYKVLNAIFPVAILLTVAIRFLFPAEGAFLILQLVTTLLMLVILTILYLTEVLLHWDLCNLFDKRGYKIWAVLMPPLCSFLLVRNIDVFFNKNKNTIFNTFK